MTALLAQFFINPLPLGGISKALLILPLCLGISTVYKATRMDDFGRLPAAVAVLWVTIVVGMYVVGFALWLVYRMLA